MEVKDPARMVSVDPGDKHVGVVLWIGATPYQIREMTPGEFLQVLRCWVDGEALDLVVCEEFRLYPGKSGVQGYSSMETSQMIGAIKNICGNRVPLVFQGASIQKPTEAQLKARGVDIRSVSQAKGPHCKSAELHGWYYLRNGGL